MRALTVCCLIGSICVAIQAAGIQRNEKDAYGGGGDYGYPAPAAPPMKEEKEEESSSSSSEKKSSSSSSSSSKKSSSSSGSGEDCPKHCTKKECPICDTTTAPEETTCPSTTECPECEEVLREQTPCSQEKTNRYIPIFVANGVVAKDGQWQNLPAHVICDCDSGSLQFFDQYTPNGGGDRKKISSAAGDGELSYNLKTNYGCGDMCILDTENKLWTPHTSSGDTWVKIAPICLDKDDAKTCDHYFAVKDGKLKDEDNNKYGGQSGNTGDSGFKCDYTQAVDATSPNQQYCRKALAISCRGCGPIDPANGVPKCFDDPHGKTYEPEPPSVD